MANLFTIGIYGWDEGVFLARLRAMRVDVLIDIRQRRGLRGPAYRFGNISRLEPLLHTAGIDYAHLPDLAPASEIRELQAAHDVASGTAKRTRSMLSSDFAEAYTGQIHESEALEPLREVLRSGQTPVLLCVEREPAACHRSIVSDLLRAEGLAQIHHQLP